MNIFLNFDLKILRHEYKNALSSFVGYVLGACVFESSMFMMLLLNLCGTELAKLYLIAFQCVI